MRMSGIVAVQSDFGPYGAGSVLTGSILKTCRDVTVYEVQNSIPQGDVLSAAGMLYSYLQFYPAGTVCLSVVGAGSGNGTSEGVRPCAARTSCGRYIVTPDNGALTVWQGKFPLAEIRELDFSGVPEAVNPYAWAAARLAGGLCAFENLGPSYPVGAAVVIALRKAEISEGRASCGIFSVLRNFGNLNLTATYEEFERSGIRCGEMVKVRISREGSEVFCSKVLFEHSFGFARQGEPVLFNGSTGYMGLGLNLDSFASAYLPETLEDGCDLFQYEVEIRREG